MRDFSSLPRVNRCLIFDLDGTLVDSLPGIAGSLNRTLAAHGLPVHSERMVRSFIGNGLRHLIESAAPQGAPPQWIEALLTYYRADYQLNWQSGSHVYPGIQHMLSEFQRAGMPMAVLSNKTHAFTVEMVRTLFPLVHFTKVLGQREGIPHKPHPAGLLQISRELGIDPERCFMIGDSTIDMRTARAAGARGIGVAWGYHEREALAAEGPAAIIEKPSELAPLLD